MISRITEIATLTFAAPIAWKNTGVIRENTAEKKLSPIMRGMSRVDFERIGGVRQHRTIPALRLKHRSGGCGTASALPKCSIMSGCGTRIVLRGQKPLALCDRCPCFGSLFPPLAALTFAASSIICAFGLASAAPRSPYRHLELCGIALDKMVDTRPGSEWFWQTDKYGTPAHKPIVEPRKCPYHNGRMCMELMRRNPDVNV